MSRKASVAAKPTKLGLVCALIHVMGVRIGSCRHFFVRGFMISGFIEPSSVYTREVPADQESSRAL